MLSLPQLQVFRPSTVQEAVALAVANPGSQYIAGGTDLLPNLKQGLYDSRVLVSVSGLGLNTAQQLDDGSWILGAGLTLQSLASHAGLRGAYVGLSDAAAHIAGPQHRARGTLGGNVMLDTRCLYYNQTPEWRESLGYCLKRSGDWCHVIG
ncbi:MAG: 4-hydroxybenzoyl-CoA reductase subunit beta, partial [Kiritimatiellia bacterium]